jgi:hypothetical protein
MHKRKRKEEKIIKHMLKEREKDRKAYLLNICLNEREKKKENLLKHTKKQKRNK